VCAFVFTKSMVIGVRQGYLVFYISDAFYHMR